MISNTSMPSNFVLPGPSTSRQSHITYARPPPKTPKSSKPKKIIPERGYFADVDTGAEVLPVRRGLGGGDLTKRSTNRWQSDFIWNSNWQAQLDYEDSLRKLQEEGKREAAESSNATPGKGFLSLTSKVDLNSLDVDLSQQLKPRPKPEPSSSQQQQRTRKPASAAKSFPAIPATRGEVRSWDRSGKYSTKVIPVAIPTTAEEEQEIADRAAAELAEYERLKQELQLWATGLTAVCLAATFAFYGRDIAASYGVGALAGLFYLRLLNKSVDGVGGGFGALIGQNRLLIPIILALGYNRYNTLAAEQTGLQLQLLPMLVGFFTYKGAVVARQGLTLFGELAASSNSNDNEEQQQQQQQGDESPTSVERAFKR